METDLSLTFLKQTKNPKEPLLRFKVEYVYF